MNCTFPSYIPKRDKGQRRDKYVTIDYNKVRVVGESKSIVGYNPLPQPVELLLAEVDGRLYPCWRKKAEKPGQQYAIQQDFNFKSVEFFDL